MDAARADLTLVVPQALPENEAKIASNLRELEATTTGLTIYEEDEEFNFSQILKDVKGYANTLEAKEKEIVDPLNKVIRLVRNLFKPERDRASIIVRRINDAIIARHYRIEAENQRRAAEAQAAQRAQHVARAEQQALKLEHAGRPEEAARTIEEAKTVELPPVVAEEKPQTAPGVQLREIVRYEITHPDMVPREYCDPSKRKIRAYAVTYREKAQIPGVRIWLQKVLASEATQIEAQDDRE